MRCRPRPLHGFTLIELLVVISIIALPPESIAGSYPTTRCPYFMGTMAISKMGLSGCGEIRAGSGAGEGLRLRPTQTTNPLTPSATPAACRGPGAGAWRVRG